MNAAAHRSTLDRIDDSRITLVTGLGSPCRAISGCSFAEVPGTGRCETHASTRVAPAPTVGRIHESAQQRCTRLALELVAIAETYVRANMRAALEGGH